MAEFATARVFLGDAFVGALAESSAGEITFEYDSTFAASGLEISPIQLPLARASAMSFPELRRKPAFLGLPGVFADALPDAFGNAIIQRYFEERGCAADALSPVQKLLYVGNRAMGALSFKPAHERGRGDDEVLEVQSLVEQARRVIEGDTTTAIPEIMQVGWWRSRKRTNPLGQDARAVRSGHRVPRPGEQSWIIKFDGVSRESVGHDMVATRSPAPWGRIEFVYSRMARDAGINNGRDASAARR